jgi:hypothetical protein
MLCLAAVGFVEQTEMGLCSRPMRYLVCLLLISCSLANAAETWRWVDAKGVIHYSDRPVQGAERVGIRPTPNTGTAENPANTNSRRAADQPEVRPAYTRCAISSPANDQVFNAVNAVTAAVEIAPALLTDDRIQVLLNGRAVSNWPGPATNFKLTDLYRGSYTMVASVVNVDGKTVCTGSPTSFHIRQPSLLAPLRKPAPNAVPRRP